MFTYLENKNFIKIKQQYVSVHMQNDIFSVIIKVRTLSISLINQFFDTSKIVENNIWLPFRNAVDFN